MDEQIKDFSVNFFKNLGCELEWKKGGDGGGSGDVLFVRNIPPEFEKFADKNGPYILVFDSEVDVEDAELMSSGGYLLKIMNKYLEGLCQTTLLKINFNIDSKAEIIGKFPLRNCEILRVDKKDMNEFFTRFTFRTTFRYLNEVENVMNSIYVKEGDIVDFYLTSYDTSEGREQEIPSEEVKKDYVIAKEKLKTLIEYKTKKVSENLGEFLERETDRIKKHYDTQIKEIEVKGGEGKDGGWEKEGVGEEIRKLRKEEKFFLNDEIQKHSLSIKNKLMNTTVIYYPIFRYSVLLGNDIAKKIVELDYNPLTREFGKFNCDNCSEVLDEFILCSSGHLTCRECGDKCGYCENVYCKKCDDKGCSLCNRKLCVNCVVKCAKCRKEFCKDHTRIIGGLEGGSGERFCINCVGTCTKCKQDINPDLLINGCCEKCHSSNVGKKVIDEVFGDEW
jgi:hypothetical protein